MHGGIVTDYVRMRMAELGNGEVYTLRMRHFMLRPAEAVKISIADQLLVLIEPVEMVRVESAHGLFDLAADSNELQYEHSGDITITSYGQQVIHVRFLQAIPHKQMICL